MTILPIISLQTKFNHLLTLTPSVWVLGFKPGFCVLQSRAPALRTFFYLLISLQSNGFPDHISCILVFNDDPPSLCSHPLLPYSHPSFPRSSSLPFRPCVFHYLIFLRKSFCPSMIPFLVLSPSLHPLKRM